MDANGYNLKSIRQQFKDAGVFYTPLECAKRLKQFLPSDIAEIYDPTCGRGGLLQCYGDDITKYGQDIDAGAIEYCKSNYGDNFVAGDVLNSPAFLGKKFRAIVMNPPFSVKWDMDNEMHENDPRWQDMPCLAPKSKADWMFIVHGLYYLADDGVLVAIVFPGILYRGQREAKIREWIIKRNLIDRIEDIPANTFTDTGISTVLLVFRKNRKPSDPIHVVNNKTNQEASITLDYLIDHANACTPSQLIEKPEEPKPWEIDPDYANKLNEEVERTIVNNLRKQIKLSAHIRQVDDTIRKPFSAFLDELRRVIDEEAQAF